MAIVTAAQYGLYALTVALGAALLYWVLRSRRLNSEGRERVRRARAKAAAERTPVTVTAVRGMPASSSMAEALAGVRFPVHWQPDPPVEVVSPFSLTTNQESAEEMADMLTDELARLGYRITPVGPTSASAVRDRNQITIAVDDDGGTFVSSKLTLTEASGG